MYLLADTLFIHLIITFPVEIKFRLPLSFGLFTLS